jgi:hypothetical protein
MRPLTDRMKEGIVSPTDKQLEAMKKAKMYRETGAYSKLEETAIYLLEIIESYERELKDLRRRLRNLREG